MDRIQILLVDMPPLLRDLVEEAVSAQPDMNVVATVPDGDQLVAATRDARPDFVLFALPAEETAGFPKVCIELLDENPRTKAIALEAVQGHAFLYELRPERATIGEVAPEDVVAAIREAAARPRVG